MSSVKRSIRKSIRSRRQSNLTLTNTSSSDSDNEKSDLKSLKTTQAIKKDGFSLLDDLRQPINNGVPRATVISLEIQLVSALLINTLIGYLILEPLMPRQLSLFHQGNPQTEKRLLFSARLSYVFLNSCFSLVWVLFSELYKLYLRTIGDIRSSFQVEISLSEQIKLNNRIKMAERVHIRSLSTFLLVLICQLNFAFIPTLIPSLYRAVPGFTFFYFCSRVSDFCQPKRLRIFSHLVVFLPISICFLYNMQGQMQKLYHEMNFFQY